MFEELGQRLQHYANVAADFRNNVRRLTREQVSLGFVFIF